MRILQLIQKPQLRGAEIFACQLSEELIARGHDVRIVYLFNGQLDLVEKFPGLTFVGLGADRSRRFMDVRAYRKLHDMISSEGYTLVQANAGDTLKYAALSKLFFRWKIKLVYRNANLMSGFLKSSIHKIFVRFFLWQCNFVISVSENCRLDICAISPRLVSRSATVSIGTHAFDAVAPVLRDTTEPVWINIGSLVTEKNHTFLVRAFHAFYRQTGSGYLWLVGDGPLRKALEEQVHRSGLAERVKFLGVLQHVVPVLKAADVLVMPSFIEGMPGVILEALSCQVPVVASAVGGIPEVIEDRKTGICISGYDPGVYADAVRELLSDEALRSEVTRNAYTVIRERYLLPQIADKFLGIYASKVQTEPGGTKP